jgi:hypothetical protein
LVLAVLVCVAGAGLALLAARASWAVEVTVRPAPLPDLRTEHTGGDVRPWLPAVAWVALAGAGALLATRTVVRQVVGGLLVLAGAGIALGAGTSGAPGGWPVLAAAGGLAVVGAGGLTVARSRAWPAMGTRYERGTPTSGAPTPGTPTKPAKAQAEAAPEEIWNALDRGEDPTA